MRNTNRTLVCDRCGADRAVTGFRYMDLHGATSEGWIKYTAVTAREKIDQFKYRDLCPDCADDISSVMEKDFVEILRSAVDLDTITDDDIKKMRDYLTASLRERRKR